MAVLYPVAQASRPSTARPAATSADPVAHAARTFQEVYGREPRFIAAAPGRVNIIGEHTDYNDGYVMPMAIERCTVVAAAPSRNTGQITLRSTTNHETVTIDLQQAVKPLGRGKWANYPAGVIAGFQALGVKVEGFDALVHSNVPLGGGLSSSAALEVAMATVLEAITGQTLEPVEKALLCQQAEHDFAGMPCGIMDQFISVMGEKDHLLLLDCRSRKSELVALSDPGVEVLIINTNVKHELTGGEYSIRRQQCETAAKALGVASLRDATTEILERGRPKLEEVVYRRARHVIGEIDRTVRCAEEIRASNWLAVGELMYASHDSLRDDYDVSCEELDTVVKIARDIGARDGMIGCRMTGGGFGGCAVALVQRDAIEAIKKKMAADYKKQTGIEAVMFTSRPAAGAMIIKA